MSERGRQQEKGQGNSGIERPSGSRNDEVDSRGTMTRIKTSILRPDGRFILNWHAMFVVSCVAAVCVDPLFFYLPVINEDDKCLAFDSRLKITAICFRSVTDLIYLVNIILQFLCPYIDEASRRSGRPVLVTDARLIARRYMSSLYFVIDILAILPIPQVLVPIIFLKRRSSKSLDIRTLLNVFVLLQYVPRVLRIYLSWAKLIEISREQVSRSVWDLWIVKAAFNLFLYIIASHVLGAIWYFFSIEREMACWHIACENHIGCTPNAFICAHNLGNYTFLDDDCPVQTPNTKLFDFGIFLEALQSSTVASTNIPQKIMHCFWWGLRNLSSLGQNLQTSAYLWENCFAVSISIFGLLLFLLFIGNVQTYMQMATEKSEMAFKKAKEIRLQALGIQQWTNKNQLRGDIEQRMISFIQRRLGENKYFDTDKPIPHLPLDLTKEIKLHLCLPLLKKVQILENQGEFQLRRMCERLKPLYYNEESYIIREGEPLTSMLFITQGSVYCFKTSNGENGEGTVSGVQCIEKGNFCGEQLLDWGFNISHPPELLDLPTSPKTVKTLTKVEAFALTANDLKNLVSRHFRAANLVAILRRHNEEMAK